MRRVWIQKISLCLILIPVLLGHPAVAATPQDSEITKSENINTPKISTKQRTAVASYMKNEAKGLKNRGYMVETMRNDEVIVVTIPASVLFYPNETYLLESGKKRLEPLNSYLKTENRFKLIIVTHSDDTGSQEYKNKLTGDRMDAILEYLQSISNYPEQSFGYAMADTEPRYENDSRENREKNRRVEIYIVPEEGLIQKLKK